jgi:hypothetical protein
MGSYRKWLVVDKGEIFEYHERTKKWKNQKMDEIFLS